MFVCLPCCPSQLFGGRRRRSQLRVHLFWKKQGTSTKVQQPRCPHANTSRSTCARRPMASPQNQSCNTQTDVTTRSNQAPNLKIICHSTNFDNHKPFTKHSVPAF
uniref:Uncharacterized protein n=1 Tax=Trypanosoma vivax (strain Y486) TaxID=1055687 RepID=G0TRE2_TRYVY|nr:hypothetical protein, unlikely [Trypanosoma vivax Y486]